MNREQRRAQKRAQRGHSKPPVSRKVWRTDLDTIAQTMAGTLGVMRDEVMPACHLAEQDLIETAARYQRTGRMGLSGQAIEHLRDVIRLHEQQRASVARSVYEEAIRLTGARIKNGHATVDLDAMLGKPLHTERKAA